ncbi:hypothetical protein CVS30_11870 [Arthrobacter psychrolactophilus]|uniref:Uncharacterized protein n=1 Tax=Arthrobacter psychrolactophilus TaxID=92442 RepID=A0A2V5INA1_9MICC|nr:hypothetical protein CVS30_11870 [Arthrobacter psychrolactophilus]
MAKACHRAKQTTFQRRAKARPQRPIDSTQRRQPSMQFGSATYYWADVETLIVSALETLRDELESRYAAPLGHVYQALISFTVTEQAPQEKHRSS